MVQRQVPTLLRFGMKQLVDMVVNILQLLHQLWCPFLNVHGARHGFRRFLSLSEFYR